MSQNQDNPSSKIPKHLQALFEGEDAKSTANVEGVLPDQGETIKTGRLGRAFKMSRLAVGGGSKWLMSKAKNLVSDEEKREQRDKETGMELATQMLKTFSEMRGVAMKMGQMLSYMDNFLPAEAQKVLAMLQRDAPPMEWSVIEAQLEDELGGLFDDHFDDFETTPIAAASIGQVHRAKLKDGTPVAVKVQYPGIADAMRADLKNTKILGLFQKMLFFRTDAKAIMQELETRFLDECDYTIEADYQETFYKRFEGHPTIVIPKVYRDLCTSKVLVTEFQEGLGFYEWIATDPSAEARKQMTHNLYRFYLGSLYLDGLFNCDPHPGNYVFRDDGKIAFLDFGCCRRFEEERRQLWIQMCKTVIADQTEDFEYLAVKVGFFPEGLKYDEDAFVDLMRYLYRPYLEDKPFDWREHPPETTFRRMFVDNPNLFKLNMPHDAVFLNRIGFGLVSIQAEINHPLNCRQMVQHYFAGQDPDWPEDPHIQAQD